MVYSDKEKLKLNFLIYYYIQFFGIFTNKLTFMVNEFIFIYKYYFI